MYKGNNNTKREKEEEEEEEKGAEYQYCLLHHTLLYLPYLIHINFMMCWSYSGLGACRFTYVTVLCSLLSSYLI